MALLDFTQPTNFNSSWFAPQDQSMGFGDLSQFTPPTSLDTLGSGLFQGNATGGADLVGGNFLSGTGLGANLGTLNFGLGALGSLNSIMNGFKANRLARDQFNFTRDTANTNLNNSIQSYNTALEGRTRARTAQEGGSAAEAAAYVDRNRLTR